MSFMAAEIAETGGAIGRQLAANAPALAALAAELRASDPPFVATIARGSSDHAALFLKHVIELKVGLACASLGPSIASLYRAPLRLGRAVAITISQSGRSPDIVAMQQAAKQAGATTIAFVNDPTSPAAREADSLLPLHAGEERSVAATKSMIASLVAGLSLAALWSRGCRTRRRARAPADDSRSFAGPAAGRGGRDAGQDQFALRDRAGRDLRRRRRGRAQAEGDLGDPRRGVLLGRSAARAGRRHRPGLSNSLLRAGRRRARQLYRHGRPTGVVRRRAIDGRRRSSRTLAHSRRSGRRECARRLRSPRCTLFIVWPRRSRAAAAAIPTSRRI